MVSSNLKDSMILWSLFLCSAYMGGTRDFGSPPGNDLLVLEGNVLSCALHQKLQPSPALARERHKKKNNYDCCRAQSAVSCLLRKNIKIR